MSEEIPNYSRAMELINGFVGLILIIGVGIVSFNEFSEFGYTLEFAFFIFVLLGLAGFILQLLMFPIGHMLGQPHNFRRTKQSQEKEDETPRQYKWWEITPMWHGWPVRYSNEWWLWMIDVFLTVLFFFIFYWAIHNSPPLPLSDTPETWNFAIWWVILIFSCCILRFCLWRFLTYKLDTTRCPHCGYKEEE